jgi:hypothetical protein
LDFAGLLMFGDPFTKRTGLWLRNLSPLVPTHAKPSEIQPWMPGTNHTTGEVYDGIAAKGAERSLTFPGIAEAMARTWGA